MIAVVTLLMLPLAGCTRESPPLRVALGVPELLARAFLNEFGTAEGVAVTIESATARGACADCDVVWSADLSSALALPLTALPGGDYGRPPSMVGAEHRWVAASAVARVIAFDPNHVSDESAPTTITELARPDIASRLILADPRRGDAAWQAAALFGALGEQRALDLYRGLIAHGALIAADEDAVIATLLEGTRRIALTNSDRAFAAQGKERTLVISVLDQEEGGAGAFLVPAVVGITEHGAAHQASRALVEFLLSPPVTRRIALTADAILVLDDPTETPAGLLSIGKLKLMPVSYAQLAGQLPAVRAALAGVIEKPVAPVAARARTTERRPGRSRPR